METKSVLLRNYILKQLGPDGTNTLIMQSQFAGTFGPILIRCICELDGKCDLLCTVVESSGENPDTLYMLRNGELLYFCQHILPLFQPKLLIKDEVSFPQEGSEGL